MDISLARTLAGRPLPIVTIGGGGAKCRFVFLQSLSRQLFSSPHTTTVRSAETFARAHVPTTIWDHLTARAPLPKLRSHVSALGFYNTLRQMKKNSHCGITDDAFAELLAVYKQHVGDPLAAGKARQFTLVPAHVAIKVSIKVSSAKGRYLLECLGEDVPEVPEPPTPEETALERLEARATRSLTEEIAEPPSDDSDDSNDAPVGRRVTVIVPSKKLRKQIKAYTAWRTEQLNGQRAGEAVALSSVGTEVAWMLRYVAGCCEGCTTVGASAPLGGTNSATGGRDVVRGCSF